MKRLLITSSLLLSVCSLSAQQSGASRFALGAEGGTTGIGPALWITASPKVTLNLGYSTLDADESYSTDGIDYDGSIDLENPYALIRWHPFAGNFNIAVGAVLTENEVLVTGQPTDGTYEVGGTTYPAAAIGTLGGNVQWDNSVAPYLGIGWSKRPEGRGWGAFLDLGVMDSGSADAMLEASGPIADEPLFQQNLAEEEQEVNDELDEFDLYPVIKLGLMYRF